MFLHIWKNKQSRFCLILLLLLFIATQIFFLVGDHSRTVLLFYPKDDRITLEAELRNIPKSTGIEDEMKSIVKEILLHPVSITLNPIVPEGVNLNFLIYDHSNETAYLDFSREMVIIDRANGVYPADSAMVHMIEQNLMFHFPRLKNINISIEGKVPFESLYRAD